MRLSPVLVAILSVSTAFGLANAACGETVDSLSVQSSVSLDVSQFQGRSDAKVDAPALVPPTTLGANQTDPKPELPLADVANVQLNNQGQVNNQGQGSDVRGDVKDMALFQAETKLFQEHGEARSLAWPTGPDSGINPLPVHTNNLAIPTNQIEERSIVSPSGDSAHLVQTTLSETKGDSSPIAESHTQPDLITATPNQPMTTQEASAIDPQPDHQENVGKNAPTDQILPENFDLTSTPIPQIQAQSDSNTPTRPNNSEAEPLVLVAEVTVTGVEGELADQVYSVISTKPGRTTTRSQLQQDINEIFKTGFFANVRAVPEDTPLGVRISFVVEANPVLQEVRVEGNRVLPTSLIIDETFAPLYGKVLNLKLLEDGIKKINKWYQDNGYTLAQVLDSPEISKEGTIILQVAEGEIESFDVRFLNKEGEPTDTEGRAISGRTRSFVVLRELEQKPGDVFNRNKAEADLRRVFGLGIFEDVRLGLEPGVTDPKKARVIVNLIEKNTGSFAAGAGVSSASGLFGTVSYQEQNLWGKNHRVGTEVSLGERTFLVDLSYTNPWIEGDPYRTSYTVNAFRRRTVSVIFDGGEREVRLDNGDRPRIIRTGGGINFVRPLAKNPYTRPDWTASLGLQYQRVQSEDADGDTARRDELGNTLTFSGTGADDLLTLQFGLSQDRRNDRLQPTSGYLFRLATEQSIPVGTGSIFFNRIRATYNFYVPVKWFSFYKDGPQALAFTIQGGTVIGDLPPYEAFPLGGSNSIRGYDEGEVGAARHFIQGSIEYRFPVTSFLNGVLFLDGGSALGSQSSVTGRPGSARDKPGSGYGYGFGLRIQSPLGPIRVDWGFNDEGDNRFHFGIGERF